MKETGKVIYVGAIRRGIAARSGNEWVSQDFVIETLERYPRKLAFTMFGEVSITNAALRTGEEIEVIGYADSHEYNGSWYTELRCTDICVGGRSRIAQYTFDSAPLPPQQTPQDN